MKPNFACFSQNLDYALGWMVIHSLWQAIAIALIMGIVMIVLRKQPARVRYWVANASLLLVLLSAMATFIHYYDFTKGASAMRFIPEGTPSVFLTERENPTVESPSLNITGSLSLGVFKNYFNEHIPLIVMIWVMGVALFILKLLGGISYCYYLRSRLNFPADEYWIETLDALKQKVGVKQSIELVESALTRAPMVVGIMKPMILFPIGAINRLSPTEVEAILAHEIAHVMRKDYIFNVIQSVIEALFYFHPAVWWISSIIRNERENCCDDVAIEICGSSMNYAKALVTVQEMAYYPMYQPALAFAGNRKNQLLFRVQRILNQPQNKTNVMEKLIATCLLVFVMVGLSFGDNNFNNDPNVSLRGTNQSDDSPTEFLSITPDAITEGSSLFLKYTVNGELDSFPLQKETKNGTYNYEDNTQKVTLTVLDNMVTSFNINDVEMAKSDISKFEKLINKIITSDSKQSVTASGAWQEGAIATTAPEDKNGFYFNSDKAKMSADENGLHMNAVDDNGQHFNLSVDENGFNMDGVDENGKPIKMNIDKNGVNINDNKNATYIKNGIVTTFDNNGDKWVIKPEKDGIKYIERFDKNEKLIEKIKMQNGKVYINDRETTPQELRQRGWEINSNGINRIGGFKNLQPGDNNRRSSNEKGIDLKKQQADFKMWQKALYAKAKALGDAKDANIYWTVKQTLDAAEKELKQENPSLNDLNKTKEKLNWVRSYLMPFENNSSTVDVNDAKEELQNNVVELRQEMKELRQEIKECGCTANFDFRMALIGKIDGLLSNFNSSANQESYNSTEMKFLKIKNEWEKGECDENKSSKGSKSNSNGGTTSINSYGNNSTVASTSPSYYSYGTGSSKADAERARMNAVNAQKNAERARKNNEQTIKDSETSRRDSETARRDSEISRRDELNQMRNAQNGADDDKKDKAIRSLFKNLINGSYIALNKKCQVEFDNNRLKVEGKSLDNATFTRIKKAFEAQLGKKSTYSILFNGFVRSISESDLNMEGSFSTSVTNDD